MKKRQHVCGRPETVPVPAETTTTTTTTTTVVTPVNPEDTEGDGA